MLPILNIYSCRETLDRLEDYLDRELSADEIRKVDFHLRICHQCARKFSFEARLLEEIRSKLDRVQMPSDLKERIAVSLQQEIETSG